MSLRLNTDPAGMGGSPTGDMPVMNRTLLIADDDRLAVSRLSRGLESRGFSIRVASGLADAIAQIRQEPPDCLIVEPRLPGGNGLDLVTILNSLRPDARIVVVTAYGNIATAVAAIKGGAEDYLPKPADVDDVFAVLSGRSRSVTAASETMMSADRVRWEHIQRVFELCDRNVSETARRLNMHRRTLQRILAKRAPR